LANLAISAITEFLILPNFTGLFLESLFSGITFLFLFIAIANRYLSPVNKSFWLKFIIIGLGFFALYVILAVAFGESLISWMGLEISALPENSLLTESEFRTLSLYTYGISSITNALTALSVVYFLQKYLIHYLYHGFKLLTKYRNYFEKNASSRKPSFLICVLWLILLPFPIQQTLSPNTVGISIVGTVFYLPAALVLFVLWGLKLTALVGVTKTKIFRLYDTFNGSLIGFLVFQWLSVLVYSLLDIVVFQEVLLRLSYLLLRSIFAFGPQAIITAYLFKRVLESRAQTNVTEYLKRKDKLSDAEINVTTNHLT
jgi:hypothetical protein